MQTFGEWDRSADATQQCEVKIKSECVFKTFSLHYW